MAAAARRGAVGGAARGASRQRHRAVRAQRAAEAAAQYVKALRAKCFSPAGAGMAQKSPRLCGEVLRVGRVEDVLRHGGALLLEHLAGDLARRRQEHDRRARAGGVPHADPRERQAVLPGRNCTRNGSILRPCSNCKQQQEKKT